MKKSIILFLLLLATATSFSQVKTFGTQVKLKKTPNISVPDSVVTKDASQILRTTSIADLGAVLSPIFSTQYVDLTTNQTIAGTKSFTSIRLGGDIDANLNNIHSISGLSFDGSGDIGGDISKMKVYHNTQVEIESGGGTANIVVAGTSITTGMTNLQVDNAGSSSLVTAGWVDNEITTNAVTQTSQLTNDGSDGVNPYIDTSDFAIAFNSSSMVIGGMAGTITDETILASYFSFTDIDVLNFSIIGEDVYAVINSTTISINNNAFLSNTDITFIKSTGITSGGSTGSWFNGCTSLEYADLPNLTNIRLNGFKGCTSLNYDKCNFQSVNYLWQDSFSGSAGKRGQTISFPSISTNAPSDGAFEQVQATLIMNNMVNTVFQSFNMFYGTLIARKITTPTPASNNNVFNNTNTNTILYLNPEMATANGGQPDGDIGEALANGSLVVYIGNRNTSQFDNDGADGVNPYITDADLPLSTTTYYVDQANGSDITGTVGNISKPYQTLDAIFDLYPIADISVSINVIMLSSGTYPLNNQISAINVYIYSQFNTTIDVSGQASSYIFNTVTSSNFIFSIHMPIGKITNTSGLDVGAFHQSGGYGHLHINVNEIYYDNSTNEMFYGESLHLKHLGKLTLVKKGLSQGGFGGEVENLTIDTFVNNATGTDIFAQIETVTLNNFEHNSTSQNAFKTTKTVIIGDMSGTQPLKFHYSTQTGHFIFRNTTMTNGIKFDQTLGNITFSGVIKSTVFVNQFSTGTLTLANLIIESMTGEIGNWSGGTINIFNCYINDTDGNFINRTNNNANALNINIYNSTIKQTTPAPLVDVGEAGVTINLGGVSLNATAINTGVGVPTIVQGFTYY